VKCSGISVREIEAIFGEVGKPAADAGKGEIADKSNLNFADGVMKNEEVEKDIELPLFNKSCVPRLGMPRTGISAYSDPRCQAAIRRAKLPSMATAVLVFFTLVTTLHVGLLGGHGIEMKLVACSSEVKLAPTESPNSFF
jgi:hypothetical protein